MRNAPFILLIVLFLGSCEEPIEWKSSTGSDFPLVIEAMLTNKAGMSYVNLSRATAEPGGISPTIDNASVLITDGTTIWPFLHQPGSTGRYLPASPVVGAIFKQYRLIIIHEGSEYSADAVMVPVTPLKQFGFNQVNWKPGYFNIITEEGDMPSYLRYEVIYANPAPPFDTVNDIFYTFTIRTIDVNQFFKPPAEKLLFPFTSQVIRTKYSMAPEHERFIRSLLSETEWKGGWFDLYPGNLFSNIKGDAVGFFSACSVVTDTVSFNK